ncbi:hypothetical protein SAMN04515624_1118 [Eubacterium maltosivorans]|uniref:hypothetical protein n=1 Tax=Eubacterium maltosivorans TaxID=2041044 RepID=UPI00088D907B|nr:hypothetical protein [Eubacterium maltosivorans]WPK79452.1 hypothetical protein EUMA32_08590 [Eubacterium maltosivorans]SDP40409.1 hypothetical protein SAMN04515624_1118 [Eubacterium maltosivorans]
MKADEQYHFINYDNAVRAYEGEYPRLTRANVAEFFSDLERGAPVAFMNRGTPAQPMTAIVFADETVLLWPRSPHFVVDAVGRYFDKDMKQCRKNNQKRFGYRRHFPIILGEALQLLPVVTKLPDGGRGISFLCRHFFIHLSEEKVLVSLSGLAVGYCCPSSLIRDKILELMRLCRALFVKELLKNGRSFSLANNAACCSCALFGQCHDQFYRAFGF